MYLSNNTALTGMCIITEESKRVYVGEKAVLPYFRSLDEHPHYMDRAKQKHRGHNTRPVLCGLE
jgi:hypothetical protein